VIHVVHVTYAASYGGAASMIVNLCNRLDPARFRVSIVSLTPNGGFEHELDGERVALHRVLKRRGKDLGLSLRLARLLWQLRPDVVHTHASNTLLEGRLAGRAAGARCFVHNEHGTVELRPQHRWLQRQFWQRADQVVAVSEILRERMARGIGFDPRRIRVIHNGVDVERFRPDPDLRIAIRRELSAAEGDFVIGAVGRHHPVKGHRHLIEAFHHLPDHLRLWLVGDGELRRDLEGLARSLGLESRVRFLGHRNDVHAMLAALDVLCQPSLSEGMSVTVLEAMASGLPIVATAVGGNVELVSHGESGLLVPAQDPAALAGALLRLATCRDEAKRLGQDARRRAQESYSVTTMVSAYEQLYERLLPGKARRGLTGDRGRPQGLQDAAGGF